MGMAVLAESYHPCCGSWGHELDLSETHYLYLENGVNHRNQFLELPTGLRQGGKRRWPCCQDHPYLSPGDQSLVRAGLLSWALLPFSGGRLHAFSWPGLDVQSSCPFVETLGQSFLKK